ncbi:hypothetical protein BDF19DRAFT_454425 [Syncephalis fuscata]|nr:hypothetical protein BDF19DRAFT_454425 [Syncephalis fuscata]
MTSFTLCNVISTCALIALCSVSLANAIGARIGAKLGFESPGYIYFKNDDTLKGHGFASIKWIGGSHEVSVGDVVWNNQRRFLKCIRNDIAYEEDVAFNILKAVKDLIKNSIAKGKDYIQQPLHSFKIPEPSGSSKNDVCYIYSFAYGIELDNFIDAKSWAEKATFLPQVFYQVAQGTMYLRYANLIHNDLEGKNIMVWQIPNSKDVKVTIIDYDVSGQLVQNNVLVTKKLVPPQNLDKTPAYNLCNDDNTSLSKKIFRSITGVFPRYFHGSNINQFKTLLEIFQITANISPQITPNELERLEQLKARFINNYQQYQFKLPILPTQSDTVAAKKLLKLLKFMVALNSSNSSGCLIPIQMLTSSTAEKIKKIVKRPWSTFKRLAANIQ